MSGLTKNPVLHLFRLSSRQGSAFSSPLSYSKKELNFAVLNRLCSNYMESTTSTNKLLAAVAQFITVLFHPLLVMTYMLVILLLVNPYQFGVYSIKEQWKLVFLVFLSTFALPSFALILMRSLNMVDSLSLESRQERIGPYIITGTFYLWMFISFKHNQAIPQSLTIVTLGATIGLFLAFFFNNFTKISAHAVGMGGLVGMAILSSKFFGFETFTLDTWLFGPLICSSNFVVLMAIVLAGMVCTSRLLLNAHTEQQVYGGLAAGFLAQFIALYAIG